MQSFTAKISSAISRGVKFVALASGDRAIKSVTPLIEVSQTSRTNSATCGLRLASAKRSTTKAETTCGSFSPQWAVNRTSSDSSNPGACRARSEERRVGKECRGRGAPEHERRKEKEQVAQWSMRAARN